MTLKPLVALTVIQQSLAPGQKADKAKGTPEVAPISRTVQPFRKTGFSFMAKDQEQQDELFRLGCVAVAPEGTPLDPEAVKAETAPVKKPVSAAAMTKPKPAKPAKPAAEEPAAPVDTPPVDTPPGDDGTGMV